MSKLLILIAAILITMTSTEFHTHSVPHNIFDKQIYFMTILLYKRAWGKSYHLSTFMVNTGK